MGDVFEEERELGLLEAERLTELGRIEFDQSRYGEAQRCFEAALETFGRHGNRAGEGQALGNLGIVFQSQGCFSQPWNTSIKP